MQAILWIERNLTMLPNESYSNKMERKNYECYRWLLLFMIHILVIPVILSITHHSFYLSKVKEHSFSSSIHFIALKNFVNRSEMTYGVIHLNTETIYKHYTLAFRLCISDVINII